MIFLQFDGFRGLPGQYRRFNETLNTELIIQLNIHLHARYVVPIVKHIMTVKQNTVNGTIMIGPRHEKT